MKVMFLGDVHASAPFMHAAIDFANVHGAEMIVQAGDFGVWEHVPAGVEFLDGVDEHLRRKDLTTIFVDGNHENFDALYRYPVDPDSGFRSVRERIFHAPRGHGWNMGGLNFLAFGGAKSPDGPEGPRYWRQKIGPMRDNPERDLGGWWPQESITPEDLRRAQESVAQAPIDVMVTHDCPSEADIPGIKRGSWVEGEASRAFVSAAMDLAKPQLLVCGHYHRRHSAMANETRVEILSSNEQKSGHAIFLETDDFSLITEMP